MAVLVGEIRVPINSDQDIVVARQKGRILATEIGFSAVDTTLIATTISELARNIVSYAKKGEIVLQTLRHSRRKGILIVATDNGPGIPSGLKQRIFEPFYTTTNGSGLGLAIAKRNAQVHGGTLIECGQLQRGIRFELFLPAIWSV